MPRQVVSDPGSAFGAHNVVVEVVKSFYTSIGNMTAIVGLTPLQLVGFIGSLGFVFALWHLVASWRGRGSWSLEE